MNKVTDKELLAICNLSNLKMEFANYIKKAEKIKNPNNPSEEIEILTNHTIYSLIENELNGQKTRDSIREKYEKNLGSFVVLFRSGNMKKYIITFLIGIVAFVFFKLKFNPESILLRHLEKRYNKEFVIAYGGKRSIGISSWYEAEIYPKELVGTPKEKDKYYWAKGFVENGKGGDTYGKVLLNESANNFYLPKLKELFGENVLPVLDLKGGYIEEDYVKEMELRNKLYKERPDGNFNPLSGGIYIFGRVESDEDREWYRKQIYEFVQFMKETGTFEYVSLEIFIIDERVLKDDMINNNEVLTILENNRKKLTRKEFFNLRNEILGEYPTKDVIKRNMLQINKGAYIENGIRDMFYQGIVFYKKLNSPKYIESNNLEGKKKLNYNNLEELQFEWEKF